MNAEPLHGLDMQELSDVLDDFSPADDEDVLDLCELLHDKLVMHWDKSIKEQRRKFGVIKTRAERAIAASAHRGGVLGRAEGDVTLDRVQHMFHHGMGIRWSGVQVEIFNVFVDTCLPKIYGEMWPEHMARVLRKRGLKRTQQEALINMGRRNGKTFVTSGTAAALLLCVPDISIAIFSTGERTARMLMDVVRNMIKAAFAEGTVVKESDFSVVQSNKEILLLEGPDGTKRLLGCYPGSVRVSHPPLFFSVCVCVCVCVPLFFFFTCTWSPSRWKTQARAPARPCCARTAWPGYRHLRLQSPWAGAWCPARSGGIHGPWQIPGRR